MKLLDPLVAHVMTGMVFFRMIDHSQLTTLMMLNKGVSSTELLGEAMKSEELLSIRLPLMDNVLLGKTIDSDVASRIWAAAKLVDGLRGVSGMNAFVEVVMNCCVKASERAKQEIRTLVRLIESRASIFVSDLFDQEDPFGRHIVLLKAVIDALPGEASPEVRQARRAVNLSLGHAIVGYRRAPLIGDLEISIIRNSPGLEMHRKCRILVSLQGAQDAITPQQRLVNLRDAFMEINMSPSVPDEAKLGMTLVAYEALKAVFRKLNMQLVNNFLDTEIRGFWMLGVRVSVSLLTGMIVDSFPKVLHPPQRVGSDLARIRNVIPANDLEASNAIRALFHFYGLS
jgi:hypothetical protein